MGRKNRFFFSKWWDVSELRGFEFSRASEASNLLETRRLAAFLFWRSTKVAVSGSCNEQKLTEGSNINTKRIYN